MLNFKKHIFLLVLCICFSVGSIAQNERSFQLAKKILDELYEVSGQYVYEKPELRIAEENRRVAAYHPKTNLITIDEKALSTCASMGSEEANALAFLLGHELAHAFQREVRKRDEATHFMAYDKHYHSSLRTEKVADIQGVFTGYLAGYGLKKAIPELLEKLYIEYNIDDSKLTNYPSFAERATTAKEVVKVVADLEDLLKVNEYLIALGRHDLSIYCLEYILEYYQGREIHNNLGVAYLTTATDYYYDSQLDKFAFPFEIDETSAINKIDTTRGELNTSQRILRNTILQQGLTYFEKAIELDNNYFSARLNKVIALNLLDKQTNAMAYLNSQHFSVKEKNSDEYRMVLALTLAWGGINNSAALLLNSLRESKSKSTAAIADFNYKMVKNENFESRNKQPFNLPTSISSQSNSLQINKSMDWKIISLDEEDEIIMKKNSRNGLSTYTFSNGFEDFFSIVLDSKPSKTAQITIEEASTNIYAGVNFKTNKNNFFIKSPAQSTIVKVDKSGNILELGKYYE